MWIFGALALIYLEENFTKPKLSQWDTSGIGNAKLSPCFATHASLPRRCLVVNASDSSSELSTTLATPIRSLPLFAFFTAHGVLPMSRGSATLSLGSLALVLSFGAHVQFEFNTSSQILRQGVIEHEAYLTHSLAVVISRSSDFLLYVDGMALGVGTLPSPDIAIDRVSISVHNGNASVELGNVRISDDPDMTWAMTVSSLLRFRAIERAKVKKDLVDEMERRLLGGNLHEKLSTEEEEGVLLEADAFDPRKFVFPFKSRTQQRDSVFDLADDLYDEGDTARNMQVDEVPEDDFRAQDDEEREDEL
jgi:hypothetical protein